MIKHVKGDIFESGVDVICHQVNCQGAMNSGVAKQVREKYPIVYKQYKRICDIASAFNTKALLGMIQPVYVGNKIIINIFAQDKYGYDGKCYTNYISLLSALEAIKDEFSEKKIAIPYLMGCHRGGGDWDRVYEMIERVFADCDVTLYEYNGG